MGGAVAVAPEMFPIPAVRRIELRAGIRAPRVDQDDVVGVVRVLIQNLERRGDISRPAAVRDDTVVVDDLV